MTPLVAAAVLASAILHPLWYALVKRHPDPAAAYLALVIGILTLGLTHALIAGAEIVGALDEWPLLALSVLGQIVYGRAVVLVLKGGDLSAYYPVIRSSPLAIVLIGWVALDETYSPALLAGIGLVLAGAFFLQYKPGARLLADPLVLGLAVLAMLGSATYSIADSRLAREIHPAALLFWTQLAATPFLAATFGSGGIGRRLRLLAASWAARPWHALALAPLAYASYYLILLAYGWGGNVAAVNAVRQVAIPISVLIGGMWLAEGEMRRRLPAALVLAAGVVAIVLAR